MTRNPRVGGPRGAKRDVWRKNLRVNRNKRRMHMMAKQKRTRTKGIGGCFILMRPIKSTGIGIRRYWLMRWGGRRGGGRGGWGICRGRMRVCMMGRCWERRRDRERIRLLILRRGFNKTSPPPPHHTTTSTPPPDADSSNLPESSQWTSMTNRELKKKRKSF